MNVSVHPPELGFSFELADSTLHFSKYHLAEANPTGQQVLAATNRHPVGDFLLYEFLSTGDLHEVLPDDVVQQSEAAPIRFVAFASDRAFRIFIDDRAYDWGATHISGRVLKRLAGVNLDTHDVFLIVPGGHNRRVKDAELIDLGSPGVEHFATIKIDIDIVVNTRAEVAHKHQLTYWEVVHFAHPDAGPHQSNVGYTVTYSMGPPANPAGNLVAHQSVHIKEAMEFYVILTDKS